MSPITHFLAGWALAHTADLNPRERMLVSVGASSRTPMGSASSWISPREAERTGGASSTTS